MAYDERLAERVRDALKWQLDVEEKAMFGGLCFMVSGHMAVGLVRNDLMVRVGPDGYADALGNKGARPMDFTGRPLKSMVYVGRAHLGRKRDLEGWVGRAVAFVATLPAKRVRECPAERAHRSRLKLER